MLTYNEIIELRKKLVNGDITVAFAKELYWKDYKDGKRAWHTKDWKERRANIIKEKCEICDSKEILTIQHLSHPRKYSEYEREVTRKHSQIFNDSNAFIDKYEFKKHIITNYDYEAIPLCPSCGDNRPSKRVRKLPQYRCVACKHEFDEPFYRSVDELITIFYENEEAFEVRDKCFVSKDKWSNLHNLPQVKYWLQREMVKAVNMEVIEGESFLLFLNDNIKYLSFENTITACKKCASNYDLNNMELCPHCKEHYKGIQYPTCIQCLPEEKRKIVIQSIELGKKWNAMHKNLEID